jgi:PAS domain S-box-containing protein
LSLKYRIAVTIVLLAAGAMMLVLWQTSSMLLQGSRNQLAATERVILALLRDLSRPALLSGEFAELQPYFERVQHDPHVFQVLLADAHKRIVASTDPRLVGAPLPHLHDGTDRLWRLSEISNVAGPLGVLAVEFSYTPLREAVLRAREASLSIALLGLVGIASTGLIMGFLLTRRLHRLTRVARHVAQGNWHVTSGVSGTDELAQVGQAFDAMVRELAADRAQLEDAQAQLEQRLLEQQRTEDSLRHRVAELTALAEVGRAVTASLDPQVVLDLIVEHARQLLNTERSALAVLEPEGSNRIYRFIASRGLSEQFPQRMRPQHWRDGTTAMALAERRPVWSADLLNDPDLELTIPTRAAAAAEGYRAVLSVPLLVGARALGCLVVYRDTPGPFTPNEIDLLQIFAAQAAIALENARLFVEGQQRQEQLAMILETNKRIATSEDMQSLLADIAKESARLVGADGASVRILRGERLVAIGQTQHGSAIAGAPEIPLSQGTAGRSVRENCVIMVEDIQTHPEVLPAYKAAAAQIGLRSFVNIPIRGTDRVIGVLAVTSKQSRVFTKQEIAALATCAEQAAITVERAQLLEEIRHHTAHLTEMNVALQNEITERTHTEQALRESEARYRTLVEGSIQGISITNRDGIRLFANRALAEMLGYDDPADLVGQDVMSCMAPHEQARLLEYRQMRVAGHTAPARYEYEALRRDGTRIWLESLVSTVSWDGAAALQGALLDITDRKRAEAELRDSEVRYRTLVDGSIQGVFIHQDFVIRFANPAMAQIFGYHTADALMGQDIRMLVAPHERVRFEDYRTAHLQGTAISARYEWQGRREDGSQLWVESVASVVSWEGRPAILMTLLDITERKRLEVQLLQAQKMEAIGTLAGGIAHDFNNILAAMLGYTELALLDVPASSKVGRNLHEVLTAGKRARDLVQQILAFSRQQVPQRQPVHLPRLVQEGLSLLRASLPSTITIRAMLEEPVGAVLVDPTQIHQVLINLCANAEHAMRARGGLLEVSLDEIEVDAAFASAYPTLHTGPHVRLRVRDTGHGIAPDIRAQIFDPFFTTKEVGEGSGMGLAVVHGIVTSHGGTITVSSAPGEGTTFDIYLPRAETVPNRPSPAEETVPGGTERILFIDDEPALTRMGKDMLEHLGYTVVVQTSSLDALELFSRDPNAFDLVITDQTMPYMTGEELAAAIRRQRPELPVILCTGFSHTMTRDKAAALGLRAFLFKPLVTRDLALAVRQALTPTPGTND